LILKPSSVDLLAQDQRGILKAPHPGAFEVQVIANGSDFQRQKTRFITLIDANHAHFAVPPPAMNGYTSEPAVIETPPTLDPIKEQATKRSALLVLALTNLVIFSIIGIVAGIWWWRKHRQVKVDDNFNDL
jgi:hypothetical protein